MLKLLSSLALALPLALYGQATDTPYQVNYASNLNAGDGVVNVTNTGASATSIPVAGGNSYGDICVNAYVYAPDQELATCCTCLVSPNSLHSWPVFFGAGNLLQNVTNGAVLNSIRTGNYSVVIKLLATVAAGAGAGLNPSCPSPATAGTGANVLVTGMLAWGSHSHPTNTGTVAITETPFSSATLSAAELGKLMQDCSFNLTLGSQGQCPGCRDGGLATSVQ